jgi:hypothetical protein
MAGIEPPAYRKGEGSGSDFSRCRPRLPIEALGARKTRLQLIWINTILALWIFVSVSNADFWISV